MIEQSILRETKLWYTLRHANLLPLLGCIYDVNGLPSLISPYCKHGNVVSFIQKNPAVDRVALVRLLISLYLHIEANALQLLQIGEGLKYMHDRKIIHSDIKSVGCSLQPVGHVS